MLGKNLREMNGPRLLTTTTKLTDAICEHWREKRRMVLPTLEARENEWESFWLNASSAHDWCPRMCALHTSLRAMDMEGMEGKFDEVLEPELLWLFDQGHAYHDLFQQKILPCLPGGVFQGSWTRLTRDASGGLFRESFPGKSIIPGSGVVAERGIAPRPDSDGWEYAEAKFRFPAHRVVVKLDGVLAWPDAPHEVLEIKTEKLEARESLNPAMGGLPRAKHVVQSNVAMWATGLPRARILYVFKGAPDLRTALLEHVIERDDALIAKLGEVALACVEAVRTMESVVKTFGEEHDLVDAISDNLPPRLDECPMKSKGRARYCPGRDLCFPAGYRKKEK